MNKLPNREWDTEGMRKYSPAFKALLKSDDPLPGSSDDNPEPTKKAVKIMTSETSQADLQPKKATQKRKTMVLRMAEVTEIEEGGPAEKKKKKPL